MSTMPGSLCLLQNLPFCSPMWLNLALVLHSSLAQTLTMVAVTALSAETTDASSSRASSGCLLFLSKIFSPGLEEPTPA